MVCEPISHEVCNLYATIVAVAVCGECAAALSKTLSEGVRDHAVAGLEANLRLEGVGVDSTNLLQGYVGAVEETCVICAGAFVTHDVEVLVSNVSRVGVNIDLNLAVQSTNRVLEVSSTPARPLLPFRAGV